MTAVRDARALDFATSRPLARRLAGPAGVTAALAVATLTVATLNPHTTRMSTGCLMLQATGWYCPGCGGTRAVYDISHGDFVSATKMNPLVTYVIVPLSILALAYWGLHAAGVIKRKLALPLWLVWVAVGVMVAFTVVRNLPAFAPYISPITG